MKKIVFLLIFTFILSNTTIICSANSSIQRAVIEPKASYVFDSTAASISKLGYDGDFMLVNYGSGSIEVILQFLNPVYSGWQTYNGNKVSGSFSNKIAYGLGGYCTLPAGQYRSKCIVTATVNGITETKTCYSPTLTVK